ncbi:hypothetical protein J116_005555 [Streptomyces thermolilacinus SPC6]|uniref:Uncharacterized protein n=1 Tax=Streptomyces thermolilacinus SPC6 TaxID=1306406 RepID=A0A1D3DNX6_9ACTN|nr:hypothetical protein J116_005555 [Streptomyces thermolilacinus SPC6]
MCPRRTFVEQSIEPDPQVRPAHRPLHSTLATVGLALAGRTDARAIESMSSAQPPAFANDTVLAPLPRVTGTATVQ